MRKNLLVTVLFLLAAGFLLAQGGKMVAVSVEKEVSIQNNDTAAARTTALALAARDAVEKAYGTYVKVEELPNSRQVLARAAAGLQYKILAEQQKGSKYWVKIQASVLVPSEYVTSEDEERESLGESMKSFVQKYPQGEINWGEGLILAFGKGTITESGDIGEQKAARAAEVDAKAHLLEIINDIPLDSETRSGEDRRMSFALEGFVQGAEVVASSKSGTTVNVTVQAPIRGVKGLTMTVYGYYTPPAPVVEEKPIQTAKPKPETKPGKETKEETKPGLSSGVGPSEVKPAPPKTEPGPVTTEGSRPSGGAPAEDTGIVIDARKTALAPALFPRIEDTEKRQVYGVQQTAKDDLQKRGMASYAVVAPDAPITRLYPRALVVRASWVPPDPAPAPAAPQTKRRQGHKPLVVNAAGASGKLNANLVISAEDAQKIRELDQSTGALQKCRVVVVVSSEVGGLEGMLLLPGEL